MNKPIKILTLCFAILSLSACSIAPGIPGMKGNSSRYAKPQKEGVDYKLVVINANTIRNQKAFDYADFIGCEEIVILGKKDSIKPETVLLKVP